MNLQEDILPLTDFRRRTAEHVRRMKDSGRPLILTVNGRAEFVVQDAGDYQALLERVERAETLAAVQESREEYSRGEGRDAVGALQELKRAIDVPR